MSARLFVDGGWLGLRQQAEQGSVITPLTVPEALNLAADIVAACLGANATIVGLLRDDAQMTDPNALPAAPNGTDYPPRG